MSRIGIIGAGVSGLTAAYLLSKSHDVTLFESNDYFGGHTNTISLSQDLAVDTGFIVFNHKNYPLLSGFWKNWMLNHKLLI